MKVFLAGATGVIGCPLTSKLVADGHQVVAISRSRSGVDTLRKQGATPVVCDALDREQVFRCVAEASPEVIVNQLTALPHRIDPSKMRTQLAATNRLRTEGTKNLFDAALAAGCKRFVSQSVAFMYDANGEGLWTEDDPLYNDPPQSFADVVAAVRSLEETTLSDPTKLPGVVLRYGFFYGQGTAYGPGGSTREDVLGRAFPIAGGGTGVFSFVHVDDAADATIASLANAEAGIYNVVDDEPAAASEWLPHYAEAVGAPKPMRVWRWLARWMAGPYVVYLMCDQRGASNEKAKRLLDWEPQKKWREELAG